MIGEPTAFPKPRRRHRREQVDANAKTYLRPGFSKSSIRKKPKSATTASGSPNSPAKPSSASARNIASPACSEREDSVRARQRPSISVHDTSLSSPHAYDAVSLKSDVELGAPSKNSISSSPRKSSVNTAFPARHSHHAHPRRLDASAKIPRALATTWHHRASRHMFAKSCPFPTTSCGPTTNSPDAPHKIAALKQRSLLRRAPSHGTPRCAWPKKSSPASTAPIPPAKPPKIFQRVFRDRQSPTDVPVQKIPVGPPKKLIALLVELKLAPSKSEASASSNKVVSN